MNLLTINIYSLLLITPSLAQVPFSPPIFLQFEVFCFKRNKELKALFNVTACLPFLT
jgi:hypothetical protein